MFGKLNKFFKDINIYLHALIISSWYQKTVTFFYWLLYPLELTYKALVILRVALYKSKVFKIHKFKVPIIVVGNLTVGGTGKTPMVSYLVNYFNQSGRRPAVIATGYKAKQNFKIAMVTKDCDPAIFGDEAVMLAKKLECPIVVGKNKVQNVEFLLSCYNPDVVICDDGLQHYALGRDLEILLIDEDRYFGNLHHLPLGPLREDFNRVNTVDFVFINKTISKDKVTAEVKVNPLLINFTQKIPLQQIQHKLYYFYLNSSKILNLINSDLEAQPADFNTVHAVAGIGNNQKFFDLLNSLGINTINHTFPDHYNYTPKDLWFLDDLPIIMTEKDAIKCKKFAKDNYWYLVIEPVLELDQEFKQHLNKLF